MFIDWRTPSILMEWATIIAWVGVVIYLTYISISAIYYLTLQDALEGTKLGDTLANITGLKEPRNKQGIVKLLIRFFIAISIMALLATGSHITLMTEFWKLWLKIFN